MIRKLLKRAVLGAGDFLTELFEDNYQERRRDEQAAAQLLERIEASAAQGGGAVVLPSGREIIVHPVRDGRLDVGGKPVGFTHEHMGEFAPKPEPEPTPVLTGSRAARFGRRS